jgi:hypothetical protein
MTRVVKQHFLCVALAVSMCATQPLCARGAEGASHHLILPWVAVGFERESQVSIMNVKRVPTTVQVRYVGAVDTPFDAQTVGITECDDVQLDAEHALTLPLSRLCPRLETRDVENLGYLELRATADSWALIAASQVTQTRSGTTFRVDAEPLGAFDRSASETEAVQPFRVDQALEVRGLIDEAATPNVAETTRAMCSIATVDEPKTVTLQLMQQADPAPVADFTITLQAREMRSFDVVRRAGLAAGTFREPFRVTFTAANNGGSVDGALLIAGCGSEFALDHAMDYRLARTAEPADESRRRYVKTGAAPNGTVTTPFDAQVGPYAIGAPINRTDKVVLHTYLQSEDRVQCSIDPEPASGSGPFRRAFRDWLDMRIVNPRGVVVAGGAGVKDVSFETGRRADGADGLWRIEISPDGTAGGLPRLWGPWAVLCESASGMSYPLPVPYGLPGAYANFPDDY